MTIERLIARGTQSEPPQCTKLQFQRPLLSRFFRGRVARLEANLTQLGRMRQSFWGTQIWYGFQLPYNENKTVKHLPNPSDAAQHSKPLADVD